MEKEADEEGEYVKETEAGEEGEYVEDTEKVLAAGMATLSVREREQTVETVTDLNCVVVSEESDVSEDVRMFVGDATVVRVSVSDKGEVVRISEVDNVNKKLIVSVNAL